MKAITGLVLVLVTVLSPTIARAGNGSVSPGHGGFITTVTEQFPGTHHGDTVQADVSETGNVPVVYVGTGMLDAFCAGINWSTGCEPADVGPIAPAAVTPGLVATAFQHLPLPASQLQVQPPNGRTLVNFDTNFYTENGEFTRTVTLLGRRVQLRIWPARYGWRFGDGGQRWTTTPGDRYPHLEVTHRYLRKGRVSPSVDTTYAAQFRVNGGPWRDVTGTVTIPGTPQPLRVVTARPVLVGG